MRLPDLRGLFLIPAAAVSYLSPLFVFAFFSFTRYRRENDLVFQLGLSRVCVWLSTSLTAGAAVLAVMLLPLLCGGAICVFSGKFDIDYAGLLSGIAPYFLNALLLCGYALITCAVSGTRFGAFTVLLALLAGPRTLMGLFSLCLDEGLVIIDSRQVLDGLFGIGYFSPLSLIPGIYPTHDPSSVVFHPVYTLFVTLALWGLGLWGFVRLSCETAGRHYRSGGVSLAVRCTLPACAFAAGAADICCNLYYILHRVPRAGWMTPLYAFAAGVVLLVFITGICAKDVKAAVRSLRDLWLPLAVCAVFLLSFAGLRLYLLNTSVRAADIESVRLDTEELRYSYLNRSQRAALDESLGQPLRGDWIKALCAEGLDEMLTYEHTRRYDREVLFMPARIRLKNGLVLRRNLYLVSVPFSREKSDWLIDLLRALAEYEPDFEMPAEFTEEVLK